MGPNSKKHKPRGEVPQTARERAPKVGELQARNLEKLSRFIEKRTGKASSSSAPAASAPAPKGKGAPSKDPWSAKAKGKVIIRDDDSGPVGPRPKFKDSERKWAEKGGSKKGSKFGSRDDRKGGSKGGKKFEKKGFKKTQGGSVAQERGWGKAILEKNPKGFGFLVFEDRKREDAFVPPSYAEDFFHGDRVEALVDRSGELRDIRLIERRIKEVVGRFIPNPAGADRGGWIAFERRKVQTQIRVLETPKGVAAQDWVRAKLEQDSEGGNGFRAKVLEVFGPILPARIDVEMIAREFNLIEEHTPEAIREAEAFGKEVSQQDIDERDDYRHIPFMTIDGETARDFDDAVFVERNKSGYFLWVAIADVSHYVVPGTAIDTGAKARATSVYFPERAFHMLPRALSENLCSLKPNVPRLAQITKIEFDYQGTMLGTDVFDGVIMSRRRATYNEVFAESVENAKNKDWEMRPHFELYQLIRATRIKRGSIDFDFPEAEVLVDKEGEPISITIRERNDAHRLIEEFMIAANEAVTHWIEQRHWPFLYRIHSKPSEISIQKFEKVARTFGVVADLGDLKPESFARFLKKVRGHAAEAVLNMSLLRSLKQAIYSAEKEHHFGLASVGYTHFTSPIRRYPDLVVHRLLRRAFQTKGPGPKGKDRERLQKELDEIASHCSYRERLASEADREAIRLKQARILANRVGDEFDAEVTGFTDNGIFAKTFDPFTEGFIHKDRLPDDFYQFVEEKMIFQGKRTRRIFKIGQKIRISVIKADLEKRMIDFALAE